MQAVSSIHSVLIAVSQGVATLASIYAGPLVSIFFVTDVSRAAELVLFSPVH